MTRFTMQSVIHMVLCGLVVVTGCADRSEPAATTQPTTAPQSPTAGAGADPSDSESSIGAGREVTNQQKARAEKAKVALFEKLSGRLMQVMQEQGPVAAIEVCSAEASTIAEQVGTEHGVAIGRTSHQLRNPNNAPREWVQPFVQQRVDTPQFVSLDDHTDGALFPIRLDVKCLMCHGGPEDILDAVKPELAKRYPDDQATGFKQGDLRGWFWVEVPVDAE